MTKLRCSVAAAACAVGALLSPGAAPAQDDQAPLVPGPSLEGAWVARVVVPTYAKSRPWGANRQRLGTRAPWGGGQVQLLVLETVRLVRDPLRPADERLWVRVRLPRRPNDADGWVPADHVELRRVRHRIHISRARRELQVFRDGRQIRRFKVVVGKPATPTPTGLFAVNEIIRQPNPRGFLGPWALHLTSHSDVLFDFGGGPGRTAIHGRDGASLADPLGTARSNGCIRIPNAEVRWLARNVEPGTPVRIADAPERRGR